MAAFLSKLSRFGTARWEELIEPSNSPSFVVDRGNAELTRVFRVAREDLTDFEAECFSTFGAPSEHPAISRMYIQSLAGEPMIGDTVEVSGSHQEPSHWKVTVNYAPDPLGSEDEIPPSGSPTLDSITATVSFTVETMTLPGYGGFIWANDGSPIKSQDVEPYIVIPVSQWSIRIPRSKSIPWDASRKCRGKVNENVFNGAEPETVLYTGMNLTVNYTPLTRERIYDIEHHFSEKSISWEGRTLGWNHFYNPEAKTFDRIYTDASEPIYEMTDEFSRLIPASL